MESRNVAIRSTLIARAVHSRARRKLARWVRGHTEVMTETETLACGAQFVKCVCHASRTHERVLGRNSFVVSRAFYYGWRPIPRTREVPTPVSCCLLAGPRQSFHATLREHRSQRQRLCTASASLRLARAQATLTWWASVLRKCIAAAVSNHCSNRGASYRTFLRSRPISRRRSQRLQRRQVARPKFSRAYAQTWKMNAKCLHHHTS